MFPSWAVNRSRSAYAITSANGSTIRFPLALVLVLLLACWGAPTFADDDAREVESGEGTLAGNSKLVLGVRWSDPGCAERLERRTKSILAVQSYLGDFDCRLSGRALSHARPGTLTVDGPFQDTLLNIPVHGQAHVEGTLSMTPAADEHRVAIDVHVEGNVRLAGTGNSHRMQIESDATVSFHAVKRLYFDNAGVTCLPATCTADSEMVFKEITSRQPKLLGKFAKRVAQQMVSDSQEAAEAECSEHVVEAICAAFDREFSNSAKIVNAALQDFLAAASNTQKEQWRAVHFRTLVDSVCITRDSLGSTQFAALPDGAGRFQPPVVLRIRAMRWGSSTCWPACNCCSPRIRPRRPRTRRLRFCARRSVGRTRPSR